jgi:septal ring factor EnvC (AmiA/AmiB activator)
MIKKSISEVLIMALSLCLLSPYVVAKDISNEQRNAYEARKAYNKNKSAYENLIKRVSQQEKRVADEQARLNQLKADEVAAKAKLDQSKQDLDEKVRALNEVWELRDQ